LVIKDLKVKLIILIFYILISTGYAGMEIDKDEPRCEITQPFKVPKNGVYKTRDDLCNDESTTYKNGEKHGLFEYRNLDGELLYTGYYVNGLRERLWRSYYSNGVTQDVQIYKKGVPVHQIRFHESGKISSYSTSTSSISMKTYQTYYDNKDNILKRIYVPKDDDGKKHGLFKEYAPNGKLRCTIEFVHGKVVNKTVYSGKLCGEM